MRPGLVALAAMLALSGAFAARAAPVTVIDDAGLEVHLVRPAQRILSLAPHATEILFEAGAGERIVGVVAYSDFPEAARKIRQVGDSASLDMEAIVALKPDLIVAWFHGNSQRQVEKVRALGIPVFHSQPLKLADIGASLTRLGELAGTSPVARRAAQAYADRLEALRTEYANRPKVTLFFQIWDKPLLTVNGKQIISDAIRLCGGINVYEQASLLVPTVDVEAVVAANPEAIVSTGTGKDDGRKFDAWRKMSRMRATAGNNLLLVRTETLGRHSPRILDGTEMLCRALDGVRSRRQS